MSKVDTRSDRALRTSSRPIVGNRVLLTLLIIALASVAFLPFATLSPNRLVSGQAVMLWQACRPWQWIALAALGALLLVSAAGRPLAARPACRVALLTSLPLIALLLISLGDYAHRALSDASPAARVSQSASFWVLLFVGALVAVDALQRLRLGLVPRLGFALVAVVLVAVCLASDLLSGLSIMREFANQRANFLDQLVRHLVLVAGALIPALLVGLPLGLLARRREAWRSGLFSVLNVFQTLPSIAVFGLLIAPLAALARAVPWLAELGIGGIGLAPAIIALVIYSLLPIVRNTYAGLAGVPAGTLEAARGMGMTPTQILWRVEVPLALPVILSGLRIVTVQAIGLAVVAALIGAGGFGAFIFQGLGQYAIDLVLLGAIPTIVMAVIADFILQILVSLSRPAGTR
ncbi:ABC transporter permease [Salinicola rhizosphaerae]|uniref:Osmoprotectant uptake system permease n=1 Tax=Salinicola rhizosphaerae TaxID=1443141 RepID=A0ABQ3EBF7_9GAMM|nr:ABC transporter permease [Salinicola rhizosphaerae]GHB32411.1 osmoprotectant uptake system permease [Salinicola rhizosphaerae]